MLMPRKPRHPSALALAPALALARALVLALALTLALLTATGCGGAAPTPTEPAINPEPPVAPATGARARPTRPTPLSPDRPLDFTRDYDFLFEGEDAPQEGVRPGAIDRARLAILHGTVTTADGAPLDAVRVSIKGRPELGLTFTSTSGRFHLAINGGGAVVVRFEMPGFLPADRDVVTAWHEHTEITDVALVPLSDQVSVVEMGASFVQIARGPVSEDVDGRRQATVIVPPATTAEAILPDGTAAPLTRLSLRATEYTVGALGAAAMPASLPASSAYTYALDISADEARAIGASGVRFSQPIPFYVENFLRFPVGEAVPVGSYDFETSSWNAEHNGRVIGVLAPIGGRARVDLDGDGAADGDEALAAEGFSSAELEGLATLYEPGTTLWRVRLPHLTPYDCNWPFGLSDDARAPSGRRPARTSEHPGKERPCEKSGSVVECDDGGLGEDLDLPGTPYSLHYRSRRQRGWKARRTLDIPISDDEVPASASAMIVEIRVAGRYFRESYAPAPNVVHRFVWDGKDVFGREVYGRVPVTGRIGFAYRPIFKQSAPTFLDSFGKANSFTLEGTTRNAINVETARGVLWRRFDLSLELERPRAKDLGGWTLDVHHQVNGARLELGDGRVRVPLSAGITELVAGSTEPGSPLFFASAVRGHAVAPDGTAYALFCDAPAHGQFIPQLYRVFPDRPREVVLTSEPVPLRDGGELSLSLSGCAGASRPEIDREGRVIIAYAGYLLRLDPSSGLVERLAGNGALPRDYRASDDMVLTATAAAIPQKPSVAIGPSGEITLAGSTVIFDLLDGKLIPKAGFTRDCNLETEAAARRKCNADRHDGFDGTPARKARFAAIVDLDYGPDGTLYVADQGSQNGQVRAIGIDGVVRRVAGLSWTRSTVNRRWDASYEPLPATEVSLAALDAIAVSRSGRIYVSHTRYPPTGGYWGTSLLSVFEPGGLLYWIGGSYESSFDLPTAADELFGVRGSPRLVHRAPSACDTLAIDPRDRLIFTAGHGDGALLALSPAADLLGLERVPSPDGLGMLVFDPLGQPLGQESALTGRVERRFEYDGAGRLAKIIETDGPETTEIVRDAEGRPVAVVGPYGHRTALTVNADGFLSELRDPLGRTWRFEYAGASGLLTAFVDPKGLRSIYAYDESGRLIRAERPDGAVQQLAMAIDPDGFSMTHTSAAGRVTRFETTLSEGGGHARRVVDPDGRARAGGTTASGGRFLVASDGTRIETQPSSAQAVGGLLPQAQRVDLTLPSGAHATLSSARTVRRDPESGALASIDQTVTVGDRVASMRYDRAARTLSTISPAGRVSSSRYDEAERVIESQDGALLPVRYSYDDRGRVISATQGTRVTRYEYDSSGNIGTSIDAAGHRRTKSYDAIDRLTQEARPGGETVALGYDLNGNLAQLTPPGRPVHQFSTDERGRTRSYEAPPTGATPTRFVTELDPDQRVARQILPDGEVISIARDSSGRPIEVRTPDGVLRSEYDAASGRLRRVIAPSGVETRVEWDGPRPLSETTVGGVGSVVRWSYDASFRISEEIVGGSAAIALRFDPDGLPLAAGPLAVGYDAGGLANTEALGPWATARTHDGYGAVTTLAASFGGSALYSSALEYDALGRVTTDTESTPARTRARRVVYTANGAVERVEDGGVATESYAYDANGNRLSATVRGEVFQAAYDAQDRLTSYGPWTFAYDALGRARERINASSGEVWSYTYDTQGNLQEVIRPDGRVVEYVADGADRRVARKLDGVVTHGYVHAGDRLIAELAPDGSVQSRFVYGIQPHVPAGMWREGIWYGFVTDARGSVRAVVDTTTGRIAQSLDYDAFGRVLEDTSPGFQPFGFAGGLLDPDTGWVRFGARDYDPLVGRWTAKDPLGFAAGDTSLYVYAFNDPVNLIDPSGEIAFCPLLFAAVELYNIASTISTMMDVLEKTAEFMDPCTSDARKMEMVQDLMAEMLGNFLLGKIGAKVGKGMLQWLAKKYGIKACFIAGTLVATPAGAAAIDSLRVGDAILALDPDTGQVAEQRVTKLLTRETPRYLDLRLERTDAS
ncbi:MAG: hypothetical protein IT384_04405, partial [Deltaproteobacteria bacterium]|nr:hypothetical protein [Deltaproteobacteria bacterium]